MKVTVLMCFVILLGSSVCASDFPTEDCGSKRGSFSKVTLSCTGTTECILKRNTNVTMNIEFTPTEDVEKVTAVVHGVIQGLPVPFPIPNPDACAVIQCPLKKGEKYNYSATFFVRKEYPRVSVDVKWEMQDEHKEDIICVLIPAKIK